MADLKDMEGPVKFKKGVELYYDPKKDMFYDEKSKKYVKEKDIIKMVEDSEEGLKTLNMEDQLNLSFSKMFDAHKEYQTKKVFEKIKSKKKAKRINEKLKASDPIQKWISDFVDSDDERFEGKTKEERIKMAKGAYYGAQNEEVKELFDKEQELTEKISCGCGPDCDHCQGKHSESEVGKKCECCGNEIIKESNSDSKNDRKLEEELLEKSEEYQKFFQSALKKFGVDSPAELDDKKKKEFFDYVDKNWEGENEEDEEETIEELSLEEAIAEAKEWKVGAPVFIVISYHTNGKHSTTVIRKKEKAMKFAKDEEYHEDDVKGTVVLDMKVGKFINKDTGEYIKEENIEERYDRKTKLKVHKAMMKKYGNDPYYKQVIDALLSHGTADMEKAIKSLVAIRGDQALKNLQRDMKSMLGEELKIEEAISEKLGPVIVISYNTNGKPYTTVIRKEENIEESRIRLSSLMNGGALIYDRDEDPDDDKLATVKVKGNPKKDIKNGDDLVLSLMDKGKSKEKEILKSLKKYYPKSKVVKEETELSEKMQKYVDACGKDFTTYSLKEGKKDYEIYHKTFTSAVEEVEKFAEKNGYEIDSDEMFNKVGTGPKKPSVGKTNEYHLTLMKNGKEDRKKLHFQVHGMRTQYELNMYIS